MRENLMREFDSCGIGFVADIHGRSTHTQLEAALGALACVKHRGAIAADARTADGAGLLIPIPPGLFGEDRGVVSLFVRGDDPKPAVQVAAEAEGIDVLEWREVPTDDSALGEMAALSRPVMVQGVLAHPDAGDDQAEIAAFRLRRRIQSAVTGTYVVSCSFRTVVYKGLAAADRVADFYPDLRDPAVEVPFAVFHQRFSTNTLPTWERAQPFRMLCHNGEINAIQGNENRMRARAVLGTEQVGLGDEDLFVPVLSESDSDSGKLDAALELLVRGGRDIRHAVAMLIPDAWENSRDMDPDLRGFYRYHSTLMEPWDGPAGVVFTDGVGVGAALDRNGLRPLRYTVCDDGLVVCASEVGVIDFTGHGRVERGALDAGDMIYVDPELGLQRDPEAKDWLAHIEPWARWAGDGFHKISRGTPVEVVPDSVEARQAMHGWTREELAMVVKPMATEAKEPVFSMGDDSPLPSLSDTPRPLHHYLKQRFAQVTNPPIDPLREQTVMSLRTLLGPREPILGSGPDAARLVSLKSFFLYPSGVERIERDPGLPWETVRLDATFPASDGPGGLSATVESLRRQAGAAVQDGAGVLIIDDGAAGPERAPVPSLLSTGAVHQALVAERLRSRVSIVTVADDVRDVHHMAALLGYGADAVCPRLALETVAHEADEDNLGDVVSAEAQSRYQGAMEAGVLKILSKMGISTVDSYRSAQIFEVIGLAGEVVDTCFTGTPNVVGGLGWDDLGRDVLARHASDELDAGGFYRVRRRGEYHGKSKEVVDSLNVVSLVSRDETQLEDMTTAHLLQRAIAGESWEAYEKFALQVNTRPLTELHDLLDMVPAGDMVPIDEVEPASEIARRFSTGAMSHGALSREAHETLAQAMNLIGGQSNCGEGGEDPYRYKTRGRGRDDKNSSIKQVASGRFGVTPEYLAHADELQIKMAQGSKPGEGGQLPGHKVSDEIARLRHTQPGVALISPPPHHDIYSIEDLGQLIYDLKQVNGALVSVKLVAGDGVGTIAAGVVKALADVVHIAGANGGTGASPLSSIKHAGMPWELGLVDTQQMLIANGLRSRVRLRVDGGFLTGRHVMIAALLGADEYSFGTSAMIAEGCIMLRACHRDTCKPGVATQRPNLRANFAGTPEGVAAYFMFMAHEVRGYLASLGLRSMDEAIGRVELLRQRQAGDARVDSVDLGPLLRPPPDPDGPRRFVERVPMQTPRSDLGDRLLADAFRPVWEGDEIELDYAITNRDRAIGAALSGAIALEYGELPPRGTAHVRLTGTAGQSFGAFLAHGVELHLTGEANDYVGKGMGGGLIVIRPPENDAGDPVLAGNTCLYGATGGELYVAGRVGQRFGVRNSGATAVVEGTGHHCCEYMTGGTIVVLGPVGHNVGAGMTGGEAFIVDRDAERVFSRVNTDLVEVIRPDGSALEDLHYLVSRHVELTGSSRGRQVLEAWEDTIDFFWHVLPKDRVRRIHTQVAGRVTQS